ncbi:hypothetical protein GCM10028795_02270 [Lysobacter olei]
MRMKLSRSRKRATATISPAQSWVSLAEAVGVDMVRVAPEGRALLVNLTGMVSHVSAADRD